MPTSQDIIDFPEQNDLLIPLEDYLRSGVHIGTSTGMKSMKEFIYRVRNDGLFVLDVRKTDERIKIVSRFLAKIDPSEIIVCSVRTYGIYPAKKFAEVVGAEALVGRFVPGSFTNPSMKGEFNFKEPSVIIVTDPNTDKQALFEAHRRGIPVIGLIDTDNVTNYIDIAIPCNNKGRNSLATVFWLLAREILRERGQLTPEKEEKLLIDLFKAPRGGARMQVQKRSEF